MEMVGVVNRTMKDKIRLALTAKGPLSQRGTFDYIVNKLDSEITIINFYLTLRKMVNEGIVLKIGDEYSYKSITKGLL